MLAKGWAVLLLVCAQLDPARMFELDDEGYRFLQKEDFASAARCFEEAAARDPGQPGLPVPAYVPRSVVNRQRMLAKCLRATGRRGDEVKARARVYKLTRGFKEMPAQEQVHDLMELAAALAATGDVRRARHVYLTALPLAETLPPSDLPAVEGLTDPGSPEDIRRSLGQLDAPPARTALERAEQASANGADAEAAQEYEKAALEDPEEFPQSSFREWAWSARRAGMKDGVKRAVAVAMRRIPDDGEHWSLRNRIMEAAGEGGAPHPKNP